MRIVFMGTPDFSVPALKALVEAGHQVIAVVTQPDKPKGRGKEVQMTPVKIQAMEYGIPVYQPAKVREASFVEVLKGLEADVYVVIAFGQILPKAVLELPKYGCINIHASLLPKYRGAAPIQWCVIDGERETGITTMMMDVGLDTGDMLEKAVIPIEEKETGGSLHDKLSMAGGDLILSTLKKLEEGTLVRTPQTDEGTCYAKMLTKSLGDIDWESGRRVHRTPDSRLKSVAQCIYHVEWENNKDMGGRCDCRPGGGRFSVRIRCSRRNGDCSRHGSVFG